MDVHCSTCEEPWDTYHLYHDAIYETGLSVEEARHWCTLPRAQRLTPRYREEFKKAGWEFGQSIVNVVHCPCCPKGALPDPGRLSAKAALEDLLGDDEDGLASALSSLSGRAPILKFPMGKLFATRGLVAAVPQEETFLALDRHFAGDWGDVSSDDRAANERALLEGSRILSVYHSKNRVKFWIITEADRHSTTILFPEDY